MVLNSTSDPEYRRSMIIGTRGSPLALWQANAVLAISQGLHPAVTFRIQVIKPEGDIDKTSSLTAIGGRGVFSSALQVALIEGEIDLAVHSTKDVPTLFPPGTAIGAFPLRDDPRDAVVSRHGVGIADLPRGPRIGTSSRRRAVQILKLRPDADISEIRGNIDTRLRKAASDEYDAVILAAAGLSRMGWLDRIVEYLAFDICTPSPGQGAIAVESRIAPDPAAGFVAGLDDRAISRAVALERGFLQGIGGGCTTPVGAHAELETVHGRPHVRFWAMLASDDGSRVDHAYEEFSFDHADQEIRKLADHMVRAVRQFTVPVAADCSALSERIVLTTSGAALARSLGEELHARGARHLHLPVIDIQSIDIPTLDAGEAVDWIVLTSSSAVPALSQYLSASGQPVSTRIAVVGERTGRLVEEAGFRVDLVPFDQQTTGLLNAFVEESMEGKRVILLLGDRAPGLIADALTARGAIVQTRTAYTTTTITTMDDEISAQIRSGNIDVVTFASPSAVEGFVHLVDADLPAISGACLVAIGPTTAQAMKQHDLPAHIVSPRPTANAVVGAINAYFGGNPATEPEYHHGA